MKRLSSMFLALVMTIALAIPAFAAGNDTVTLKIARQDSGATAPVTYLTATVPIDANDTVYDVVNSVATASEWNTVDILDPITWQPTGDQGKALNSLTFTDDYDDSYTWANNGVSTPDGNGGGHYEGQSWGYTVNNVSPDDYMDWHSVSNGDTIVLNFQFSEFDW